MAWVGLFIWYYLLFAQGMSVRSPLINLFISHSQDRMES